MRNVSTRIKNKIGEQIRTPATNLILEKFDSDVWLVIWTNTSRFTSSLIFNEIKNNIIRTT